MTARDDYLKALYTVSKTTPPEVWVNFVNALTTYTWDQMEKVVISVPTNEALVAIGMVRHMREFRDEVKDIEATVRKMDKERNRG
jgi:hypothetical protein